MITSEEICREVLRGINSPYLFRALGEGVITPDQLTAGDLTEAANRVSVCLRMMLGDLKKEILAEKGSTQDVKARIN